MCESCGSSPGCGRVVIVVDGKRSEVCVNETAFCDCCDNRKLSDVLTTIAGGDQLCPACVEEYTVQCVECEELFHVDAEDESFDHVRGGGCLCYECKAERDEGRYWEGVNHEIDRMIERRHGDD